MKFWCSIAAAAALAVFAGCASNGKVIRDPASDNSWMFYGSAEKPTGMALVDAKRKALTPSKKQERYLAATGFVDKIAFVVDCLSRNKKLACVQTAILPIDEDAQQLCTPGAYTFPELEYREGYPAMILYKAADGKKYTFPMFSEETVKESEGIHEFLFTDDRFLMQQNGLLGYIDKSGMPIIPARFLAAEPFRDGRAAVISDLGLGTIDIVGQFTAEKYACVLPMKDPNMLLVNEGGTLIKYDQDLRIQKTSMFYTDALIKRTETLSASTQEVCLGGKWGVTDANYKEIVPPQYDEITVEEGTNYFFVRDRTNNKAGFYNGEGKTIVATEYQNVILGDHFFIVQNDKYKFAIMNKDGKLATGFDFDEFRSMSREDNIGMYLESEFAVLKRDGKWGALTADGRETVPFSYDELGAESEGMIPFRYGRLWGAIDYQNKVLLTPIYSALGTFRNGRAPAVLDGSEIYVYRDQTTRAAWLEKERIMQAQSDALEKQGQANVTQQLIAEQQRTNRMLIATERDRTERDIKNLNNQIDVLEPQAAVSGSIDLTSRLQQLKNQRDELITKLNSLNAMLPEPEQNSISSQNPPEGLMPIPESQPQNQPANTPTPSANTPTDAQPASPVNPVINQDDPLNAPLGLPVSN